MAHRRVEVLALPAPLGFAKAFLKVAAFEQRHPENVVKGGIVRGDGQGTASHCDTFFELLVAGVKRGQGEADVAVVGRQRKSLFEHTDGFWNAGLAVEGGAEV